MFETFKIISIPRTRGQPPSYVKIMLIFLLHYMNMHFIHASTSSKMNGPRKLSCHLELQMFQLISFYLKGLLISQ